MGGTRRKSVAPDLFSVALHREPPFVKKNANGPSRHVSPSDLPAAVKHRDDLELDQLQVALTAEQVRRGKISSAPDKTL